MTQCDSSRLAVYSERDRTVVLGSLVGFAEEFDVVGCEWNNLAGIRQAEEPNQLAEFVGQRGEEGEGWRRHHPVDMRVCDLETEYSRESGFGLKKKKRDRD